MGAHGSHLSLFVLKTRRVAMVPLFVLFFGCGEVSYDDGTPTYYGVVNSCKRTSDCKEGYKCEADKRICVTERGAANRQVYLRITPTEGMPSTLSVTFDADSSKSVAFGEIRTLSMKPGVTDEDGLSIASRIVVTDLQAAPGQALEKITTDVSETGDDNSETGNTSELSLSLYEGEARYRVAVTPKSSTEYSAEYSTEYPPKVFENLSVVWDEEQKAAMFVDADGVSLSALQMDEGLELTGHILRGSQPTDGLTVEVVDPGTGRTLSTRDVTGCKDTDEGEVCGDFSVRKFADDTPYYLKIWKPDDPSYPSALVPSTAAAEEDGRTIFSLPYLSGPVRFEAQVEGPRVLSSGTVVHDGLSDCLVIIKPDEDTVDETVFVNAKTDDSGNIISLQTDSELFLYPGYYQFLILPPAVSADTVEAYAPLSAARRIESTGDDIENQVFILDYRYRVTVRVSANGEAVPGAIIRAVPLSGDSILAVSSAESDGTHRLWLDVGSWRLTVVAPVESGYAYTIREVVIGKRAAPAYGPVQVRLDDIELDLPAAAYVQLSSETVDLTGASVEWYEKWTDASVIQVAHSTVDASGRTVGLLPVR